jgi:hypothetical protein
MRSHLTLVLLLVAATALLSGCVQNGSPHEEGFLVNDSGVASIRCPSCNPVEEVTEENPGYSLSRIVFQNPRGDVYAILAMPEKPVAGFVLAPGAGVRKEGHEGRAAGYAREGYAYLVLDMRGNGGETTGEPLNLDRDYQRFSRGEWPQYYLSVCDMMCAASYLSGTCNIPVYLVGESNGGRYAAIAAALDPGCAGFVGVSTSGFGGAGERYTGNLRRFLLSVDPETYGGLMEGRRSWIFHSPDDPIIPFAQGIALEQSLSGEAEFIAFNGTHGSNEEVDARIRWECAQIYGIQG